MPFTVDDFHDLVRILYERPEWRAELRRLLLPEELLTLPELVRELAEIQRKALERLDRLDERVGRVEDRLDHIEERQDRHEQQFAEFRSWTEKRFDQVDKRFDEMDTRFDRIERDLGVLKGSELENRYYRNPASYFGGIVRRAHALTPAEKAKLLDGAVEAGKLTEQQAEKIERLDLIVRGRRREDKAWVYLAVEASWGVGLTDVERAKERAALLARTGTPAIAVVAGAWATQEAQDAAKERRVWVVTDGVAVKGNENEMMG